MSNAGNLVLDPIKKHFKKYAFKPVGESTEIVLAQLGNDAGIAVQLGLQLINYNLIIRVEKIVFSPFLFLCSKMTANE